MLFENRESEVYTKKKTINLGGRLICIDKPMVMGIVNVTPDSFYDGGKYNREKKIIERVTKIVEEGADFVDIGGYSTRPGASQISMEEELERLLPAVRMVKKHFPDIAVSIDTFRSEIVNRIFEEAGAFIVNDISGGNFDSKMFETVAELGLPYILMHIQGTPSSMQKNPTYDDVVQDIIICFSERVKKLRLLGVNDIILDPGFGFGKTMEQNYELLNRLDAFKIFQLPIMTGISRKSVIWKLLDITPDESLNGTTVLNTLALTGGANILRVHDVKEAVEAVLIVEEIRRSGKEAKRHSG
jgi:dihydropteroate synthase